MAINSVECRCTKTLTHIYEKPTDKKLTRTSIYINNASVQISNILANNSVKNKKKPSMSMAYPIKTMPTEFFRT